MNAARTRIGRIKMKAGGAHVRVLNAPALDKGRARAYRKIHAALDSMDTVRAVAGFCFVAWDSENYAVTSSWIGDESRIPSLLAPDFVKNCILTDAITPFASDEVLGLLGYSINPEPDAS